MSNALDQLIEKFHDSPDSFEYHSGEHSESVVWQTKLNIADQTIKDPNATERTILVTWSEYDKALTIHIFNEAFENTERLWSSAIQFDAKLKLSRLLERFRTPRWKFKKLVKLAKRHREHRKTKEFLNKMSSVFPTMLDHFLIGK